MKQGHKNESIEASTARIHPPKDSALVRERARTLLRETSKPGKSEGQHIELKRDLEFAPYPRRAEFIRDVLSLANSNGEHPRQRAYLIIGVKDGIFVDTSALNLDGATIGQIIDSHIVPPLKYHHCSLFMKKNIRTDVIEFEPDGNVLYVSRREFRDENNRLLLSPGQTWGRRA